MAKDKQIVFKDLNLQERIRYETLEYLANQGVGGFFISAINSLIVYFILFPSANHSFLRTWLGVQFIVIVSRFMMVLWFWEYGLERLSERRWMFYYGMLVILSGAAWGALPFFPIFLREVWAQSLIIFVIAGMSAGGISSLSVRLSVAIPYLLCILLPLIIVLAGGSQPYQIAMALLASLYLVLLVRSTYYLHQQIVSNIKLEAENSYLFEFLSRIKKAPDAEDGVGEEEKTWVI